MVIFVIHDFELQIPNIKLKKSKSEEMGLEISNMPGQPKPTCDPSTAQTTDPNVRQRSSELRQDYLNG
jgi:hypothetical protein